MKNGIFISLFVLSFSLAAAQTTNSSVSSNQIGEYGFSPLSEADSIILICSFVPSRFGLDELMQFNSQFIMPMDRVKFAAYVSSIGKKKFNELELSILSIYDLDDNWQLGAGVNLKSLTIQKIYSNEYISFDIFSRLKFGNNISAAIILENINGSDYLLDKSIKRQSALIGFMYSSEKALEFELGTKIYIDKRSSLYSNINFSLTELIYAGLSYKSNPEEVCVLLKVNTKLNIRLFIGLGYNIKLGSSPILGLYTNF